MVKFSPLMDKYPSQSPYVAFNNNPLFYNDPSGLEGEDPYGKLKSTETTEDVVSIATYDKDAKKNKNKFIIINKEVTTDVYEDVITDERTTIKRTTTIRTEKISLMVINRHGEEINVDDRRSAEIKTKKVNVNVSYSNTTLKPLQPPPYLPAPKITSLRGKDVEITEKLKQSMYAFEKCEIDSNGHYDLHAKIPTESRGTSIDGALANIVIGKVPYFGTIFGVINDLTNNTKIEISSWVSLHHSFISRPRSPNIHVGYKPDVHQGVLDPNRNIETGRENRRYKNAHIRAQFDRSYHNGLRTARRQRN